MTRIIAGTARGRRLRTPAGDRTRPTADRVREALFSAIESALGSVAGVRFLDLYAGSGAVGLEAASRGASEVTLVEHDRRTAALIRDNAATVGAPGARVVCAPVSRFLAGRPDATYDLVFADPPYALARGSVESDLRTLADGGWLADLALVVLERGARGEPPRWPPGYEPGRVREYGETSLLTATWVGYGRTSAGDPLTASADDQSPPAAEEP